MKIVILAGGKGTRLAEYTGAIPKPMVEIGSCPIIEHVVNIYHSQGFWDFIVAGGYKWEMLYDWSQGLDLPNTRVSIVDTGVDTLTGGRLKRISRSLDSHNFMLTYGDGVADIDLTRLYNYHTNMDALVTLTAVRPPARFGSLRLDKSGRVTGFHEKSQTDEGWVNGGFMIVEPEVFDMIDGDSTNLEKDILPEIAASGRLNAYFHSGFWQCMDTIRDVELLRSLWEEGAPWIGKA